MKRLLLAVALVLAVVRPASAQPSMGNFAASGGATGTTQVVTLPATTAGTTIVCGASWESSIGLTSLTDDKSQAYTQAFTLTVNGAQFLRQYRKENTASGMTTITLTLASSAHALMICGEVSGVPSSGVLDQSGGNSTVLASPWTSASTPSTTTANEILVGESWCFAATNCGYAVGSGWSSMGHIGNGGAGVDFFMESKVVSSTSTYAVSGTGTAAGNSYFAALATYAGSGGGGSPMPPSNLTILGVGPGQ